MRAFLRGTSRPLPTAGVMVLTLLLGVRDLSSQIAGYSVGTRGLNVRAMPCSRNRQDYLCQPSGEVYLRIHDGEVIEIDSSWTRETTVFISSPDVWRDIQAVLIARFGEPDSVRTMNTLRLPPAYSEGLAVFWTKPEWCAVLTVKTEGFQGGFLVPIDLTIDKRDTAGYSCSVYPYLEP